MQNRAREALKLQPIDMRIRTEHPVVLPISHAEALHLTRAQIPGIEGLANHAAVLTIDLETLMPVHAHRHRQVQMPQAAVGKFSINKPAIGSELFHEPRLTATHCLSQKPGR